jgi:hypothetical protein
MYTDDERRILVLPDPTDSTKAVYLDPLAVRRSLLDASGGDVNKWLDDADSDDDLTAAHAEGKLVRVARTVFGYPPIDPTTGDGVSDAVCLSALNAAIEFLQKKGERGEN